MFGVSADVAETTFDAIVAVLRALCPANLWDAEKRWTQKERSWKPALLDTLLIESVETPLARPSEKQKHNPLYSGKKKRPTLKPPIITDTTGESLSIAPGHRGLRADKRLYEASTAEGVCPPAEKAGDLGYGGLPGVMTPPKKPRGGERTPQQKGGGLPVGFLSRRACGASKRLVSSGTSPVWERVCFR